MVRVYKSDDVFLFFFLCVFSLFFGFLDFCSIVFFGFGLSH